MKKLSHIIAFALSLVLLMSSFAFAATPAAITVSGAAVEVKDPSAVIVSPADGSVVKSDSLLVSVKVNKETTIKVTIYEEKIEHKSIVTTKVSGSAVTREAISYTSVDTKDFEEKDFVSNAAIKTYVDRPYLSAKYYSSKDTISYYTAQVDDVKPGMYKVVVETVEIKTEKDADGKEKTTEKVLETTDSLIAVKEKPAEVKALTTTKEKSSALTIISNFLKSIFK